MVGDRVELRGSFRGPGKISDYVRTDIGQVYVTGEFAKPPYESEVIVRGILQHHDPGPQDDLPEDWAADSEYYFIESADLTARH